MMNIPTSSHFTSLGCLSRNVLEIMLENSCNHNITQSFSAACFPTLLPQNHEKGFPILIRSDILTVGKHDPAQKPTRFRSAITTNKSR